MTPQESRGYVVAYGYTDKFEISEKEAQALVTAKENDLKVVKFGDKVLSTNFTWIMPKDQVSGFNITGKQLLFAEQVAEWISRPVHEIDFDYDAALSYAKKIVSKNEFEVRMLWDKHAESAYPSVKKFLSEAKEIEPQSSETFSTKLLE